MNITEALTNLLKVEFSKYRFAIGPSTTGEGILNIVMNNMYSVGSITPEDLALTDPAAIENIIKPLRQLIKFYGETIDADTNNKEDAGAFDNFFEDELTEEQSELISLFKAKKQQHLKTLDETYGHINKTLAVNINEEDISILVGPIIETYIWTPAEYIELKDNLNCNIIDAAFNSLITKIKPTLDEYQQNRTKYSINVI